MKVQEQINLLNGTAGVLEAYTLKEPVAVGTKHHAVTVVWFYQEGEVVRKDSRDLIVKKLGKAGESAHWLERLPGVLEVPVAPDLGPLGTDEEVLAACPVKVVKAEIERGVNEARVSGYEVIDGKALPVTFLLYTDGETVKVVRGDDGTTKAAAGLEAVK